MKRKIYSFILALAFIGFVQNYFGLGNSFAKGKDLKAAYVFQLQDQSGKIHDLSKYAGKTVFINFWATWCPNCIREMPHIQALYKEYGKNTKDVILLTVANPSSKEYPNNNDISTEDLKKFVQKKGYEFPVLFDTTGEVMDEYNIRAFPTTFVITKDGLVRGSLMGALSKEQMKKMIELTKMGK